MIALTELVEKHFKSSILFITSQVNMKETLLQVRLLSDPPGQSAFQFSAFRKTVSPSVPPYRFYNSTVPLFDLLVVICLVYFLEFINESSCFKL